MNNKKLAIQLFIEKHSDWEKILTEKPYCLSISRDKVHGRKLIMFKYNQIDSDFNVGLVRECRGLILDEESLEPVSVPFFKFGNFGESYCPEINWKECWCGQKIDGSIIKVVNLNKHGEHAGLLISTNGTIDAFKAPLAEQIGCSFKSFGELFVEAVNKEKTAWKKYVLENHYCFKNDVQEDPLEWLATILTPGTTYMFEITSPFNKVVVSWHEVKAWFLGERDNTSFEETYFTEDTVLNGLFDTPKVYPLRSIEECVAAAKELGPDEEGYVVCDRNFNRVKVKSPTYVSLHHMRNNGCLSYERGLEIVRRNEFDEVLTYFPEFASHLEAIKEKYEKMIADLTSLEDDLKTWLTIKKFDIQPWLVEAGGENRKDLAQWAFKQTKYTGFVFAYADHKTSSAKEWIESMPIKNLCKSLGLKEDKES